MLFTEYDLHLFGEGNHYFVYEKLGAHPMLKGRTPGVYFAVWAPNAEGVSVVGNFNAWDGTKHLMQPVGDSGIWEIFIPRLQRGELYKYEISKR